MENICIDITPSDDAVSLKQRLSEWGAYITVSGLSRVFAGETPVPQSMLRKAMKPSYSPKLTSNDFAIDWRDSAFDVVNKIRACQPSGAWTEFKFSDGNKCMMKILSAVVCNEKFEGKSPGDVVIYKHCFFVKTGTFFVKIKTLKPQSRGAISALDFINGLRGQKSGAWCKTWY
jgi:methionyl-tRNA formyltransferase